MARYLKILIYMFVFMGTSATSGHAQQEGLKLACPDRYWYPFLYQDKDGTKGVFYDLVTRSLENLDIRVTIEGYPIMRAIRYSSQGKVDGVLGIAFSSGLEETMDFPPGSDTEVVSPWRLMQVDDVVVSCEGQDYEFEGDLSTLPQPVRVVIGSPLLPQLAEAGIRTEKVHEDIQNFRKLVRDRKGVLITSSVIAEIMNLDPAYQNKLKIHSTPISSISYYLVFSKRSALPDKEKNMIWKEIIRWRDDYVFMLKVFSLYSDKKLDDGSKR